MSLILPAVVWAAAATATRPVASKPKAELDYWLNQAQAATEPADAPADRSTRPADAGPVFSRQYALPGVIEFSDGRVLVGMMFTTRDKCWEVYVDQEKLWRRIPFEAVLSIAAVVDEEKTELEWRWRGMGEPEKTYTGRSYPTRTLSWRFRLIDGDEIHGTVKGQPIWIELDGRQSGPFILHERSKGDMGQKLSDLVYVKRIVVSKRLMEQAIRRADR